MSIPLSEVTQEQAREPFVIDTQERAAWAMRKLAQIRAKQTENTNTANAITEKLKAELQQVLDWLKAENQRLEEQEAQYFLTGLEAYYWKQLEENPKVKTIKLPFGSLKSKVQQPEYIRDDAKLLAWVKENKPEFIKTKTIESTDWEELKKMVKVSKTNAFLGEEGLVVDGVTVKERPPVFSVEVG